MISGTGTPFAGAAAMALLGGCTPAPDPAASVPRPLPSPTEIVSGTDFVDREYAENIVSAITRRFDSSTGVPERTAELVFVLDRTGDVVRYEWLERSGDEDFDRAARSAVRQAAEEDAFGPLPAAFEPDSLKVTFLFDPSTR